MAEDQARPLAKKRREGPAGPGATASPGPGADPAAEAAHRLVETQERLARSQTALARNELLRARIHTARDLSISLIVLALLIALAASVVGAARSRAVVVEAFTVPPDLAARGMTGEVVAQRFLDRLGAIQRGADSVRTPASFANAWSGDLRVQIPSTGISLGEARGMMRRWLGHETYIWGEVLRTDGGLTVTVRSEGRDPVQIAGGGDLDAMLQAAAEQAFGQQQPYLYSLYLNDRGRRDESIAIAQRLARSGDAAERAWGYNAWGVWLSRIGRFDEAETQLRAGMELNPDFAPLHFNLMVAEIYAGRDGGALAILPAARQHYRGGAARESLKADSVASVLAWMDELEAEMTGDFGRALAVAAQLPHLTNYTQSHAAASPMAAASLASLHRPGAAIAWLASHRPAADEIALLSNRATIGELTVEARLRAAAAAEDWPAVLREAEALDRWQAQRGGIDAARRPILAWPWIAQARAALGDLAGAERIAGQTPAGCYFCARTRGFVAARSGRHGDAERWYRSAVAQSPRLPFAYAEWGQARLARGDADGAADLFRRAAATGPRWADPLKYRGDALAARAAMRGSRAEMEEAVRLYAQAAERAPRWGALHLDWGRALWRLRRYDEARAKFGAAAGMDLAPADATRLRRILAAARAPAA